jgi:hypothetical protein
MEWTTENIKWFLEQSPPRQVDETLLNDSLNVFFPRIVRVILLALPLLMLVMIGMALVFLLRTADLMGEWRLMTEPTVVTPGKVIDVERRKGSKGSVTYVYTFEFKPADRREVNDPPVKGMSFSGSQIAASGQTVSIEYIRDNPKTSRIQGSRLNPMPLAAVLAMPLVGAIAVILPMGMVRSKKKWLQRLLAFGVTTPATIEKVKPGPKGSIVVELGFSVGGVEIRSKTSVSGRKGEKERLMGLQESGRPMAILVDPDKPKSVFLLDLLLNARRGSRWGR